jgi:hypothetical protein
VAHQQLRDRLGLCRSLLFLGTAMTVIPGSGAEGRAELESGLKLAHELGNPWGMAPCRPPGVRAAAQRSARKPSS